MRTSILAVILLSVAPTIAAEPKVHRDLAYAEPKSERQTLDVYAPADGSDHPVVVWIHGGGWRQGDKRSVQRKPQAFVDQGFRLRLDQLPLRAAGDGEGNDRRRGQGHSLGPRPCEGIRRQARSIFVMGHSAGAHLAALVCTDDRYLKAEGLPLSIIKGCVPVDTAAYDIPKRFASTGQATSGSRPGDLRRRTRPSTAICRQSRSPKGRAIPPFLILHVADRPDSKAQSQLFAKALQDAGVAATVVPAEGKTHGTINAHLGLEGDQPTKAVFEFLAKQLQRK